MDHLEVKTNLAVDQKISLNAVSDEQKVVTTLQPKVKHSWSQYLDWIICFIKW